LRQIVDILLRDVNLNLAERGLTVDVSPEVKDRLLEIAHLEPSTGARPLRRTIQRHIQDAVSEILITRHGETVERIEVTVADGDLAFKVCDREVLETAGAVQGGSRDGDLFAGKS
jgi:ATP-dependent Clp protease ATP-binding subunit ClpE